MTLVGEHTIPWINTNASSLEADFEGIDPSNTVGYILKEQIGSSSDSLSRKLGVAVAVIGVNRYRLVCIDGLGPSLPITTRFFRFK